MLNGTLYPLKFCDISFSSKIQNVYIVFKEDSYRSKEEWTKTLTLDLQIIKPNQNILIYSWIYIHQAETV